MNTQEYEEAPSFYGAEGGVTLLYFSKKHRRKIMSEASAFFELSDKGHDEASKAAFVGDSIVTILTAINDNPELFDSSCGINIKLIGDKLMEALKDIASAGGDQKEYIFSLLYRIVLELQIVSSHDLDPALSDILLKVQDYKFVDRVETQLKYADHQMVVEIIRGMLHHPRINLLRNLPAAIDRSESEREALESTISAREARVDALGKTLKSHETAYNFVGLYDGFRKLRDSKANESKLRLIGVMLLGLAMVIPLLAKIYLVIWPLEEVVLDVYAYACLLALELVLVFFFRVALHGRKSIQAQLIQLDLRMALCQFIQSYAEYASEIRKKDPNILERFEQVVFSGIVINESAIPSSFDGLEQLSGLITKFKDGR